MSRKREETPFGVWLKRELHRRQMTQRDLMQRGGFSTGIISQWVNGNRVPTPESLRRIADALYLDIDVVLEQAGVRADPSMEDPRTRDLIAKLKRVGWNEDRYLAIDTMLTSWLEVDRRKRVLPQAEEQTSHR